MGKSLKSEKKSEWKLDRRTQEKNNLEAWPA